MPCPCRKNSGLAAMPKSAFASSVCRRRLILASTLQPNPMPDSTLRLLRHQSNCLRCLFQARPKPNLCHNGRFKTLGTLIRSAAISAPTPRSKICNSRPLTSTANSADAASILTSKALPVGVKSWGQAKFFAKLTLPERPA